MWNSLSRGSPTSGESWKMDTGASMFCYNIWCAISLQCTRWFYPDLNKWIVSFSTWSRTYTHFPHTYLFVVYCPAKICWWIILYALSVCLFESSTCLCLSKRYCMHIRNNVRDKYTYSQMPWFPESEDVPFVFRYLSCWYWPSRQTVLGNKWNSEPNHIPLI